MTIFNWIILVFWLVFMLYWFVSALNTKKDLKTGGWRRDAGIRILLTVAVIVLVQLTSYWHYLGYHFGTGVQVLGIVLCAAGIAFAIWARVHLGKNWSGTPSMKEGHELITSGPYRFVRHPIYTGMLLAIIGSALVAGVIWLAVFVIMSVNFLYRIPVEERYMMQLFPDQYPEYRKRTKALIPLIW
jgi:protein-S-isoprenylcysteine O-methyltransferase Ste14